MEKRKSAGFVVDDNLWRRFKSRAADDGLPIGEILVKLVGEYLDKGTPEDVEKGETKKDSDKVRGRSLPEPKKSVRSAEKKEPTQIKKKKREEIPLEREDRFRGPRPGLAEYALLLGVEDGDEGSLRERVLDAIEKVYGERSGEDGWLEGNLAMVQWYNDNRG